MRHFYQWHIENIVTFATAEASKKWQFRDFLGLVELLDLAEVSTVPLRLQVLMTFKKHESHQYGVQYRYMLPYFLIFVQDSSQIHSHDERWWMSQSSTWTFVFPVSVWLYCLCLIRQTKRYTLHITVTSYTSPNYLLQLSKKKCARGHVPLTSLETLYNIAYRSQKDNGQRTTLKKVESEFWIYTVLSSRLATDEDRSRRGV